METIAQILDTIKSQNIRVVDLRFTNTLGRELHLSIPADRVDESMFDEGRNFDGSSVPAWKKINDSDLCLLPDPTTATLDPFRDDLTLIIRCDVKDPTTMVDYARDPRAIARNAESYLQATGIADKCYFGPEPEFFLFDDIRWDVGMAGAYYSIDAKEAAWNSAKQYERGNSGHRPAVKGGYFPVPPIDAAQDIRTAMSIALEEMGVIVEAHHHEVATCGQNEIATRFNTLLRKADEIQIFKYVVRCVADRCGKTATFMPKPIMGDNGNGMHCHQSLEKDGQNIFSGNQYAGLSDTALYYIGGIIKHARALNALANPTTNSYKRLVPGFEAPVLLAYSSRNRSAAIRIPHSPSARGRRIEVRFPDPMANPYTAFAAMLMAGIDGIKNKIHPGDPMEKDLYDLPPEELSDVPTICATLEQSLEWLAQDRDFLLQGDVFSNDFIDSYIALKRQDIHRIYTTPHPVEFDMYYSD